ncbi:terminal uridylyltransferase 4 [Drosophila kikkawai]|uniref:Terminal uridylyltransferase 4 n=1 Tax=Drosophila kikkawai TaxID=30033 RepID=A0A6P4IIP9_DROKI|nr:terminal uridylyltransferase 4 [Drosophila kikkawai]
MPAPASEQWDSGDVVVQVCMVCAAPFQSVQDCLAHELLKHSSKPQKQLRQRLNAITKLFTSKQTQSERSELQAVLVQSPPGGHLRAVLDFYASDLRELEDYYDQVRNCIEKELKGKVKVYPFGSLVTGLALKESDIDLYLQPCDDPPPMVHKQLYNKVSNFLRRSKCFADVFAIRHARVPIIRCKHLLTGLSIDINMSNPNSTYNSKFVGELMRRDERLRQLGLFLKIWAKKLKLIGHGSMTSYCLVSMIIVSLQVQNLLPSVKELQSFCPPENLCGVNYAYTLHLMPPIPNRMSTQELIRNFFVYYSTVDFQKSVVSPFLGCVLDRETTFGTPGGGFPEYEAQLQAMEEAVGERPEAFQLDRSMCVQDPFELQHNVAKSVSQSSLCYLRQCLILAAQASSDPELQAQPSKLYDYLLFGLTDKLVANQHKEKPTPPKQPKKELKHEVANLPMTEPKAAQPEAVATEHGAPPIVRTHFITPTTNDLKCLRSSELTLTSSGEGARPIYYYWMSCYVDTIKDVLAQLYVLNIESLTDEPYYHRWRISSSLDTWTGRSFQRGSGQSFFAHQLQQTIEFMKTRPANPAYAVNLRGILTLLASDDYKEIRLDVEPLPGDLLGLQRNSPLTKLFKAFKNLLGNYSFKEKASTWKYYAKSDQRGAQ